MKSYSIQQINDVLKGTIIGDTSIIITAPEQLELATSSEISFIGNKKYEKFWETSKACAAIVNEDISIQPGKNRVFIKVQNADLAMSQVLELFAPPTPLFNIDIHPKAIIEKTAVIGNGTRIGAGSYIGSKVRLGENITIYPNVTILDDCTIGKNTIIWSGAVVRERSHIGNDCIIHPNATIGADGFGFRPCPEKGLVKIPQIGNVIIGNGVEIGANTCIDRAALGVTRIGNGVKLDNQVHIGHNCQIGNHVVIAAQTGLSGGVVVGDHAIIGGQVGIGDKARIEAGAIVGSGAGILTSKIVRAGEPVWGTPARPLRQYLRTLATLARLARQKS